MTEAALDFLEEQLSARPIGEANWNEVIFMLTVFNTRDDAGDDLFARVQSTARRLSSSCVAEMRAVRDEMWAAASEGARARLKELKNFGAVRNRMPEAYQEAVRALVPRALIQQYALRFDLELMVSAMCCVAEVALDAFRSKLTALFPKARLIVNLTDMRGDEGACVMIAAVKNPERVREKVKDAFGERRGDVAGWPFAQLVGDLLRASVICGSVDALADAWSTLAGGFDVRDGRGRLKNNLWSEAERPPDLLANLVVEPPRGAPPVVGEVQLQLREIVVMKETRLHRLYEIARASSVGALLAESEAAARGKGDAPPTIAAGSRGACIADLELVRDSGGEEAGGWEDEAGACGLMMCGDGGVLAGSAAELATRTAGV